jgi:hypothetical protein
MLPKAVSFDISTFYVVVALLFFPFLRSLNCSIDKGVAVQIPVSGSANMASQQPVSADSVLSRMLVFLFGCVGLKQRAGGATESQGRCSYITTKHTEQ